MKTEIKNIYDSKDPAKGRGRATKEGVESRNIGKGAHIASFKGKRDCVRKNITFVSHMTFHQ